MSLRKFSLILAAVLSLTLLAGCGTKDNPTDDPTDPYDQYAEVPVVYEKRTAENEDESLSLYFDHGFEKTVQTNTVSTERDTYKMYVAKNEIETCQFLLSAQTEKENLSAYITDFTSKDGDVLAAELFRLEYFEANYQMTPDALCPYTDGESFTLAANTSQAFMIWVETTAQTSSGDYEATLQIKDAAEREIKIATVFLHVWDFTLSDETAATVSMDLSAYEISKISGRGDLYQNYYDFLLKNRISAYSLPFDVMSEEAEEYMNNPRVRSFMANRSSASVAQLAERLQQNKIWADKAFFYYVDEPKDLEALERIAYYGTILKNIYPDYRMVSPFFTPGTVQATGQDYLTYMADYINIWCPKAMLFTTDEDYINVSGAQPPFFEAWQEDLYGTFYERIQAEKTGGDTLWWYTCWDPTAPYITLNMEEKGVNHRILFWQQKYFNVDGFLYFSVNEWEDDSWNSHEKFNSENNTVWGDGQLIYCGTKLGFEVPVASLRLNSVRDGIEDFEYLTMLEKTIGGEKVHELISKITDSVVNYTDDPDFFATYRVRLGNYLEAVLDNG